MGVPRYKMTNLCSQLLPRAEIKNHVLFREGDPSSDVYIVKQGEIRVCRQVEVPML
jgi:CRP-like cAMP-binding protein